MKNVHLRDRHWSGPATSAEVQARPGIRWGIIGAGSISTLFVKDLLITYNDPYTPVRHIVHAIGTSNLEKGREFVASAMPDAAKPEIYIDYQDLFADDNVDIVYVGIPHSLHKAVCLAAIAAKKHVLCEKPMAINFREVDEIVTAAREKGVFLMEGKYLSRGIACIWTRFLPVVQELHQLIHEKKRIGQVSRMFCDYGCDMKIHSAQATSRLTELAMGGGALLDLGVYPLTLSNLVLDGKVGTEALDPDVISTMTVVQGVDYSEAIVVNYRSAKSLGILTASFQTDTSEDFCRIEGSEGVITLSGPMTARPRTIRTRTFGKEEEETIVFDHLGMGLYFEANAVALDILEGNLESSVMPLAETMRVCKMMDGIRRANGVVYPQDLD